MMSLRPASEGHWARRWIASEVTIRQSTHELDIRGSPEVLAAEPCEMDEATCRIA